MEKNKNYITKRIGITLTKKNATYVMALSSIAAAFFATSIMFTFPVLHYNITYIYPNDKIIYFYTLLLFSSNLIASPVCICIFIYILSKAKTFRKAAKKQ